MLLVASNAAARDEPRKATERPVFNQPGEITSVVDAFDDDNPFDLHITLGYQHSWRNAKILRETYIAQGSLSSGGITADTMNVAQYAGSTSRLNTRLDIGLYKDLALYLRMPIILHESSKLSSLDGSGDVQGVVLAGNPGEQLFRLPFDGPSRSGIEYLAVGLDVNFMNQWRDSTKPTWLFGVEGRFSLTEQRRACNPGGGLNQAGNQVDCADPSDVNRNGIAGDVKDGNLDLEGVGFGKRKPGVSRGTYGLEVHTMVSRRIKYVEPYGGFRALAELPMSNSDFGQADYKGSVVKHLPLEGWLTAGMMVVPWEDRERAQRLAFDARVEGSYRSEGLDYSELFDALGSSDAMSLRRPNYAAYRQGTQPSEIDTSSPRVYFTGITDVQAHAKLRVSGSATWQINEYAKFQIGLAYTYIQPHFITMDQPCNTNTNSTVGTAGPCRIASSTETGMHYASTGIPNPNYRPAINQVGRRFKVDDTNVVDLWFNGIVMF